MAKQRRILFICGSMNQTTMMVKIAQNLRHHDCWFTPHYTDGFVGMLERAGMLEWTIVGDRHKQRAAAYLRSLGLPMDPRGANNEYDLVLTCSDLFVPKNIRNNRVILVQEGMTDPETIMYHIVRALRLPRYLASTSTFGMSNMYTKMCVASEGYRDLFIRKGADSTKIVVTGIPNFDDCAAFLLEPSAMKGYVLVATSDARETFKYENRSATIRRALAIADGRDLVFKLHPNEDAVRATREIHTLAPGAVVVQDADINHLIAHCDTLVTKYSSCVYVGIALGKTVYSDFSMEELYRLCPLQNGGTSATSIAAVCEEVLAESACRIFYLSQNRYKRRAS